MGTIDDQMHAVMKAANEYVQAWKAIRMGPHASDQKLVLEGRRASREQDLRNAVDALLKT